MPLNLSSLLWRCLHSGRASFGTWPIQRHTAERSVVTSLKAQQRTNILLPLPPAQRPERRLPWHSLLKAVSPFNIRGQPPAPGSASSWPLASIANGLDGHWSSRSSRTLWRLGGPLRVGTLDELLQGLLGTHRRRYIHGEMLQAEELQTIFIISE